MTDELLAQIPELERQADELERRAAAIRQIVAGVRALEGGVGNVMQRTFESHRTAFEIAPPALNGPRGPEAVLQIMQEAPPHPWKVIDLKREMMRRGWAQTPKAVEASIKRLRVLDKVEQVSYGYYRLREMPAREEGTLPSAEAA